MLEHHQPGLPWPADALEGISAGLRRAQAEVARLRGECAGPTEPQPSAVLQAIIGMEATFAAVDPGTTTAGDPVPVVVSYRPRDGCEARLLGLLKRRWTALRRAGLVVQSRARRQESVDERTGRTRFAETFTWKDAEASGRAKGLPDLAALWVKMEPLLESMEVEVVSRARRKR